MMNLVCLMTRRQVGRQDHTGPGVRELRRAPGALSLAHFVIFYLLWFTHSFPQSISVIASQDLHSRTPFPQEYYRSLSPSPTRTNLDTHLLQHLHW